MTNIKDTKLTSRQYEQLAKDYSEYHSSLMTGENNPNFGKTTPIEVRQKISNSLIESKKVAGENNRMYGRNHTEESKEKMCQSQLDLYKNGYTNPIKGKSMVLYYSWDNLPKKFKPILCVETNEVFLSMRSSSRTIHTRITSVLLSKKSVIDGYTWHYLTLEEIGALRENELLRTRLLMQKLVLYVCNYIK